MKRLTALTGCGETHSESSQKDISVPTMSSLEMVNCINADRKSKAETQGLDFPCKQFRKLEHRSFMKKVPKVLGEAGAKFFASDSYINGTGGKVERDIYNFPKREACLMAMSYSYELQAQIYDYMDELDRQRGGYLGYTINELQNIVASARQFSDEDSSDAGRRLKKRQGDLVLLDKAEYLVSRLSQLPLTFGGGNQDA